jgi:hypothetical protein
MKKPTYRIRNWSEYNASLKQRGRLTIYVSPEDVENWTTDELTVGPGRIMRAAACDPAISAPIEPSSTKQTAYFLPAA